MNAVNPRRKPPPARDLCSGRLASLVFRRSARYARGTLAALLSRFAPCGAYIVSERERSAPSSPTQAWFLASSEGAADARPRRTPGGSRNRTKPADDPAADTHGLPPLDSPGTLRPSARTAFPFGLLARHRAQWRRDRGDGRR